MRCLKLLWLLPVCLACLGASPPKREESKRAALVAHNGGPLGERAGDCVTVAERVQIRDAIEAFKVDQILRGIPGVAFLEEGPARYPFHPQAGNLWDDLSVTNFVDLDPGPGVLDWDGTDFTYNGHGGHDAVVRSFAEQDAGVPIYAALDGTVVNVHDGESDRNTSAQGQTSNYVVLWHGGTHYTLYFHLKKFSVAVLVNQQVRAGTQIGLTASSGNSTYPHLHFETHYDNAVYEPYAGVARPGDSGWVDQTPIRRAMYLSDLNMTDVNLNQYAGLPHDRPRTGTFRTGVQGHKFWITLHNLPADSAWQIRYRRPNGTLEYASSIFSFNNSVAYRWSWWQWWWNINFSVTGTWTAELWINGSLFQSAPFRVIAPGATDNNRPPAPVTAAMEMDTVHNNEAVFCRIQAPLVDDPDYDLVTYRYRWIQGGATLRDVTTAANSDAFPAGVVLPNSVLRCEVTPTDGAATAPTVSAETWVTTQMTDISALVSVRRGLGKVPGPGSDRFTLTGTDPLPLPGPVHVAVTGLPPGVTLIGADGEFEGSPYRTIPVRQLLPGNPVGVSLQFNNSTGAPVEFGLRVLAGKP